MQSSNSSSVSHDLQPISGPLSDAQKPVFRKTEYGLRENGSSMPTRASAAQHVSKFRAGILSLFSRRLYRIACIAIVSILALWAVLFPILFTKFRHPKIPGRISAFPIAVRNPYLSAWMPGDQSRNVPSARALFWTGEPLGWEIMARVDGKAYTLFGFPDGVPVGAVEAKQISVMYSSTHTRVRLKAGSIQIELDFFSPVSPNNLLRHSLPYSYLTISMSGSTEDVQIFSGIDEFWSGQVGNVTTTLETSGDTKIYTMNNPDAKLFTEDNNMAQWGNVVFATTPSTTSHLAAQCGEVLAVRSIFIENGVLDESSTCDGGSNSLFAYSHDLGTVTDESSVTFAIGQYREEVILYIGAPQASYHQAFYPNISDAVIYFLGDYDAALQESLTFDEEVIAKAAVVTPHYTSIIEASVRQAFGAMEITIPSDTLNTTNPMVFLKEISSDGNVNTIDVIYPTFPILYVLAPEWIKYLIEPVLKYLVSPGAWSNPYMTHDLGRHYPIANGHDNNLSEWLIGREEFMPLDPTGSAFTMLLAYQKATNDTAFAEKYGTLLKIYADFLVTNGTAHQAQLSTVDSLKSSANQTILVVQSAIGLTAYGELTGNASYTQQGLDLADMLYAQGLGLNSDKTHFTYSYGPSADEYSYTVMFPLYMDKLLDLNTFPSSATDMMNTWYSSQMQPYGLPYMNGSMFNSSRGRDWGITDWNMWTAATADTDLQDRIINTTYDFLMKVGNNKPFQTRYRTDSGHPIANIARSTVGSNFALLALDGPWS